jgi:hypothetical protein
MMKKMEITIGTDLAGFEKFKLNQKTEENVI